MAQTGTNQGECKRESGGARRSGDSQGARGVANTEQSPAATGKSSSFSFREKPKLNTRGHFLQASDVLCAPSLSKLLTPCADGSHPFPSLVQPGQFPVSLGSQVPLPCFPAAPLQPRPLVLCPSPALVVEPQGPPLAAPAPRSPLPGSLPADSLIHTLPNPHALQHPASSGPALFAKRSRSSGPAGTCSRPRPPPSSFFPGRWSANLMGPVLDPDRDAPASEWTTGCEKVLPLLLSRNGELLGHLSSSCPLMAWGSEEGSVPRLRPRPLPSVLQRHHARPALHMLRGSFWNTPLPPRGAQLSCLILSPPGDPLISHCPLGSPAPVSAHGRVTTLYLENHTPQRQCSWGKDTSSHPRICRLTADSQGYKEQQEPEAVGHKREGLPRSTDRPMGTDRRVPSPAQPKQVGPSQLPGETQAPSFFGVCCR